MHGFEFNSVSDEILLPAYIADISKAKIRF